MLVVVLLEKKNDVSGWGKPVAKKKDDEKNDDLFRISLFMKWRRKLKTRL